MKKIYTSVLVLFALLAAMPALRAQSVCPGPNPPAVFNESWVDPQGNQVCVVYVYNSWPNSRVRLSDYAGVSIPSTDGSSVIFTDPSGNVAYSYPCSATPVLVAVTNSTGQTCYSNVPAKAALPVKLTSFTARIGDNGAILLNWTSSVEEGSFQYVIERSSDGKNFSKVGTVNAAGNSSTTVYYSFTDNTVSGPVAFYRLKQVDLDGKYIYSKVIYVNNSKGMSSANIRIFPNPFQNEIQVAGISSAELNTGKLMLFSSTGRMIPLRRTGSNAISIDETVPAGIYILQINNQRFKLVKD